jgi:AcrR family transcriptional regulator
MLQASRLVFLKRGFVDATVEEIVLEAGYTRGALYKHFDGKEGVWQALMEETAESYSMRMAQVLRQADTREELIDALDPERAILDPDARRWAVTAAGHLAVIASQPQHAAMLVAMQRKLDAQLASLLEEHCNRLGIRPAVPPAQLVLLLSALGGGLALRATIDPEIGKAAAAKSFLQAVFPAAGDLSPELPVARTKTRMSSEAGLQHSVIRK